MRPAVVIVLALLAGCTSSSPSTTGAAVTTTTTAATTTTEGSTPPASTTTTLPASTTTTTLPPLQGLEWEVVADLGGFITGIEPIDGGVLVTTKDGFIRRVADDGSVEVVADLTALVRNQGEQGLLDLALAPDGDRLFVHYSARDGDTVLAEMAYPELGEPTTLFGADQPAGNHNGGSIEFGPDGMLYLALGDGGGANDRYGNGQRTDTPLAAIHRFDVSAPGRAVAPDDNPGFEVETIWAYGVRNPWRIAFTDLPGAGGPSLVVADVGQNAWEEVTVVPASDGGLNLGWPIQEGRHCFSRTPCDDAGITMAQVEVGHGDEGTCSITGGEVYRGDAIPEMAGHYVFTDYCGGWLRSIDLTAVLGDLPSVVAWDVADLSAPGVVAAGADGELLAGGGDGRLLRLVPIR